MGGVSSETQTMGLRTELVQNDRDEGSQASMDAPRETAQSAYREPLVMASTRLSKRCRLGRQVDCWEVLMDTSEHDQRGLVRVHPGREDGCG